MFDLDADDYLYFRGRLGDFIMRAGEKICLASVRAAAAQLPNVARARTVVNRQKDEEDYDIELHLQDGGWAEEEDYTQMLRKWLRRSEMPRSVRVVGAEVSSVAAYK